VPVKNLLLALALAAGCGPNATDAMCTTTISASTDATANHTAIQTALSNAKSGDVICMHAGTYPLLDELSLSTGNVELRSMTDGTAVLDFMGQKTGANGLSVVSVDGVKLTGFTVKNTAGDAIRINQANGITMKGLTVTWDGGSLTTNGAYGLYPVQCSHVHIDGCKVSYAADAGIYVGQSTQILIENSEAFGNVAGIEFENSTDGELKNTYSHDNTGGVLVFNLPSLMMYGMGHVNVHDNMILNNNGMNFAAPSSIVHGVPSGTGVLVMAMAGNEIHNNTISGNDSVGVAVVSYLVLQMMYMDKNYNPYPTGNYIHDNAFSGNGQAPSGLAYQISLGAGIKTVEDMIWDGLFDSMTPLTTDTQNCFDTKGTFRNLQLNLDQTAMKSTTMIGANLCTHPALPSITP
jgi:parallel beta-helix repeat protein